MVVLTSVWMAIGCFSRLPVPALDWSERNMRYLIAAFPVVGLIIGGLMWGWLLLADALAVGTLLRSVVMCLIPYAVTGGIHLDGFSDVCDARSSHASPERQREIMRDPHVGAFAVIALIAYFLTFCGLCSEVDLDAAREVLSVFVLSRVAAGLLTLRVHPSTETGMLHAVQITARIRTCTVWLVVWALAASLLCATTSWVVAVLDLVALAGTCLWVWGMSERTFGGASGDVAGYLVTISELVLLAIIVFVGKVA